MDDGIEQRTIEEISELVDPDAARPLDLYRQMTSFLRLVGRDLAIHFDSGHVGVGLDFAFPDAEIPERILSAAHKIVPPLLRCRLEGWQSGDQTQGTILIDPNIGIGLDIDDLETDTCLSETMRNEVLEASLDNGTFETFDDDEPLLVV